MKDKNRETEEFFTCSGTDCTGLIPAFEKNWKYTAEYGKITDKDR